MAKSKMSLPVQMGIGMVAGGLIGLLAQNTSLGPALFKPLGDIFIRLIRMVVVPLVFATLVAGSAGIRDTGKLGRVATKTLLFYLITTALAVTIGLILANVAQPGHGLNISTEGLAAKNVTQPALKDTLMNLVPLNPVEAMAKGNMLQIIIFAIIFGFGVSALGEAGRPVHQFFEACGDTMIKVTGFVMLYAPIGVFGLMAYTVTQHGLSVLLPLAKVIGVMYLSCVLLIGLVYVPILKGIVKIPVSRFFRGILEPLMVAFTTCSSAAALPSNMRCTERLGASKTVASFGIPLGNTINMNGTALYMGVTTIFVAEVYGIPLSLETQLTAVIMSVLAAVGSMGVPGAGLIMISIVFVQIGLPLEGVALVAGIDRILDMARTPMNVLGDSLGALAVSRLEGDFSDTSTENDSTMPKTTA
ncbi:MAG: dicarboxylate/amino acid:cation symporter [Desulfovibrionaceae bacterium]|nr:dicarboxylate/amino acid:cation symporter [Desulfovibrionaceae bacterium]